MDDGLKYLHAYFGLETLALASASFSASALNGGLSAERTTLAQIAEKRM